MKSPPPKLSAQERKALVDRLTKRDVRDEDAAPEIVAAPAVPLEQSDRVAARRPSHLRQLAYIISRLLLSNRVFLGLLGLLNGRVIFVKTVFIAYPHSPEVFQVYPNRLVQKLVSWRPTLIGFFRQKSAGGLTFLTTNSEAEIEQPANAAALDRIWQQAHGYMSAVRAQEVRFAGIIPSILSSRGVAAGTSERAAAVTAVLKAEALVRARELINEAAPIILLGSDGFLGREIAARLGQRNLYRVDIGGGATSAPNRGAWPAHLRGCKAILINVARAGTLELYAGLLWSSLVVLNEVYPTPARHVLRALSAMQCRLYHIAGAAGYALPAFPDAYAGAIPCCAAQIDGDTDVVVRRLV